ncbi:MAG: DUF1592 domain-containing protein [Planctomycetota bacterium]
MGAGRGPAAQGVGVPADVRELLTDNCVGCHGATDPEAGLDLRLLASRPLAEALVTLLELRDRVAARVMPPPGYGDLDGGDVDRLVAWVDATVDARRDEVREASSPVPARRLSRSQYERAIADLFGVEVPAAAEFPAEDLAHGFATMADALRFSAVHVEKYLAAAEQVAATVLDQTVPPRWEVEEFVGEAKGVAAGAEFANFYTRADLRLPLPPRLRGAYRLRVRAFGDQAGDEPPRLAVDVDGVRAATFAVAATRDEPRTYEAEVDVPMGARALRLSFVNDFWAPDHPDPARRDRNLHLDWVELESALGAPGNRWWLLDDPGGDDGERRLRAVLPALVERAWRAPVASADIDALVCASQAAGRQPWPQPLRLALVAILASPRFVLRLESAGGGQRQRAYELAARLSFTLWGSVPDPDLLEDARAGRLHDDAVFARQVERMLRDARAGALATEFAAQWLELPTLSMLSFDAERFGEVDVPLLQDLRRETEMLFEAVLREERPVRELLTADFSFYNRRLAAHYGVEGEFDDAMRRVELAEPWRFGLLGHASILALTSNPTRTSPVKRGKWILDNLLGAPPAPPPPGNGAFPPEVAVDTAAGLREQLARHRRNDECAVCHQRMDALGLALEGFDAVGRRRLREGSVAVDTSAVMPDGRRVQGSVELRDMLANDRSLVPCLARKFFLFAVGRPATAGERIRLDAAVRALPGEVTLAAVVRCVLASGAFRVH